MRSLYIKTFSWEYWPVWVVYFPVSFYFLYLSIKARSFLFFSASNPTIETGGMFFESKWKIFQLVPKEYYPTTILVNGGEDICSIEQRINLAGIYCVSCNSQTRKWRKQLGCEINNSEIRVTRLQNNIGYMFCDTVLY